MKQLILVVVVAVAAFAIGRWSVNTPMSTAAKGTSTSSSASDLALGARAVLRIDPRRDRFSASAPTTPLAPPPSPAVAALRSGKEYAALYAQLVAGEQTAESMWLQAALLQICAKDLTRDKLNNTKRFKESTPEDRRKEFMERIVPSDPQREARIAAYERVSVDPCKDMREMTYRDEDIRALLERSAALGDDRAALSLDELKARSAILEAREKGQAFPRQPVTDADMSRFKEILARGNPEAILGVFERIGGWAYGGVLALGDPPTPVNSSALYGALDLLRCDMGYDCSANSRRLLDRCAYSGECGADNLVDATYFYSASPYHAQLIDQYRTTLQTMLRNRDFSQLRFERNPTPPPSAPTTPTTPTKR